MSPYCSEVHLYTSLGIWYSNYLMDQPLFSEIPDNFFFPLASKNRRHYSNLLVIYYGLFEEYHTGVERELVVSEYEDYFTGQAGLSADELDLEDESAGDISEESLTPRNLASLFLRKLIFYGWISEEVLADYTQVINMTAWARPFFVAISETVRGLNVEYESHVIGIYSSLCSDAAKENGHHAVLNALDHTRRLIESLKVLSQNIKTHIENMFHFDAEVRELLHIHYDLYMQEIVDKAYNRLKTSDNLSKYRPPVNTAINAFLQNEGWIEKTAEKLAYIKNLPKEESKKTLLAMLKEIRDELRNIDPILEEIDDKNRQYSRISTEKIKAQLYADASLHGKVQAIIKGLGRNKEACNSMQNNLMNVDFLVRESLYSRRVRRDDDLVVTKPGPNDFDMELLETEMLMRIQNQLNPEKIREFLDTACRRDGTPTPAEKMVENMEDFIRIVYAAAYSEGRGDRFPYRITWGEGMVQKGRFIFRDHSFRRGDGANAG